MDKAHNLKTFYANPRSSYLGTKPNLKQLETK